MLRKIKELLTCRGALLAFVLLASLYTVTHKNWSFPWALASGAGIWGAVFGAVWFLTKRRLFSCGAASVLVVILMVLNRMKGHYYKEGLMTQDFSVALDPSNFATLLHYPLAGLGLAATALLTGFLLWYFWRGSRSAGGRLAPLAVLAASAALVAAAPHFGYEAWQRSLPKGQGVLTNLLMSAAEKGAADPADGIEGTSDAFRAAASSLGFAVSGKTPDIVIMLQESAADPRIFTTNEGFNPPSVPVFDDTTAEKASSLLRVHTYGGGTWISEFSVLTGLDPDDFGAAKNAVFYEVVGHVKNSIFRELHKNGYENIVLTSFNHSAYHSGYAYETLGADRIIQPQDLGYPGKKTENLWNIRTADMLKYVRQLLDEPHGKPRFIYVLTMKEHGPYEGKGSLYDELRKSGESESRSEALSAYYDKMNDSAKEFSDFYRYVSERKAPLVFVRFGDHQPGIRWGRYRITEPNPEFVTECSVRDNLPGEFRLPAVTDISFLGGAALERAGLPLGDFYRANAAMRRLCDGRLSDCRKPELLSAYRAYIFKDLDDFE